MHTPKIGRSKRAKARQQVETKEKDFQTVANEYGQRIAASVKDDLDALKHARECDGTKDDGEPCTAGQEVLTVKGSDGKEYRQARHNDPDAWHNEDAAQRQIDEGPLEVSADKGERFDGSRWYMILLGTGGPASRIIGKLSEHGDPESATFQYQNWFKPWTDAELTDIEDDALLEYAQQFYFGE